MFTQKCFIRKNTPELVKKLEDIGYRASFSARNGYGECLYAIGGTVFGCAYRDYDSIAWFINCNDSEELFLAIAALRDDTDNMQWFTDGNGYWQQCVGSFKFPSLAKEKLHKATVQELIEHFKS